MERYTYNKELIEKLNIKYFIEKYNLNNEKYNLAIFYALSSVYEHHCRVEQKIPTKNLLFGDYYSFVYYSLLKYKSDYNINIERMNFYYGNLYFFILTFATK